MKKFFKLILVITMFVFLQTKTSAFAEEMVFRVDSGLIQTEDFLKSGNYSAALQSSANVLMRHPRNADAYVYRGYAYYKLGQQQKAYESFKTALMINPSHLGANKYLANIYLDEGKVDRALEQLQALRIVCGSYNCAEIDALEAEINNHKATAAASSEEDE